MAVQHGDLDTVRGLASAGTRTPPEPAEFSEIARVPLRAPRRTVAQCCVFVAALLASSTAHSQTWRTDARHLGTSTRVLIVGTRPDDEDNALIVWLRRHQHIETALLSLTRGEGGRNAAGAERNAPLAVVRTAELLAERERDRARQFFTRAYDVGTTPDSALVSRVWPRDSVLIDVVSIIRGFRPHVIIALNENTREDDATRRYTASLLTSAYTIAGDTVRMPTRVTARLPAWNTSRLFTRVDTLINPTHTVTRVDVGAFDRESGRTLSETGAEIGQLKRTQGGSPGPALGPVVRLLRLDSTRVGNDTSLFGSLDTSMTRLRDVVPAEVASQFDSLRGHLAQLNRSAVHSDADSIAALLAAAIAQANSVRLELGCRDTATVSTCEGTRGDLAVALATVHSRAVRAFVGASGLVVDAVSDRQLVAAGDSTRVTVTIYNGGSRSLTLRRLALAAQTRLSVVHADTNIVIPPAGVVRYSAPVRMLAATHHWWQINGLISGTLLLNLRGTVGSTVAPQLLMGEDHLATSGAEVTIKASGHDIPIVTGPIVFRGPMALRGENRTPMIGVPETSLLLERLAEYERAGQSVDRLFRVQVSSARSTVDTVAVTLQLPLGMVADSLTRTVALPPFSTRNLFFRIRGAMAAGTHLIEASARSVATAPAPPPSVPIAPPRLFTLGTIINEYPHIPSQHFVRFAKDRIESVDLRLPPRFRVGYMRGTEDLRSAFAQLRLSVQSLDLALIPVADLSTLTAIVIGSGALRSESALLAAPPLRAFMERGGVVLVLPAGPELQRSGILPFGLNMNESSANDGVTFTSFTMADGASEFFRTPNRVTIEQFDMWSGDRACGSFRGYTSEYSVPLVMSTATQNRVESAVMTAPFGKGRIVITSMCLAQQLEAAQPAAPKWLVNLLTNVPRSSTGSRAGTR